MALLIGEIVQIIAIVLFSVLVGGILGYFFPLLPTGTGKPLRQQQNEYLNDVYKKLTQETSLQAHQISAWERGLAVSYYWMMEMNFHFQAFGQICRISFLTDIVRMPFAGAHALLRSLLGLAFGRRCKNHENKI